MPTSVFPFEVCTLEDLLYFELSSAPSSTSGGKRCIMGRAKAGVFALLFPITTIRSICASLQATLAKMSARADREEIKREQVQQEIAAKVCTCL